MSNEDEGEVGVTMLDVLEEEGRLEEEARLVLGGSDATYCTYPLGYVKRQALYACRTCNPPETTPEPGGVCLACCLSCHEGHDLIEMYTKRNFRCDCGNSRFPANQCKLVPGKVENNEDNNYNHNFRGLYCVCERPYPDPEVEEQQDMLQCGVCEDWFHLEHLNVEFPSDADFEMVCAQCVDQHDFLRCYEVVDGKPRFQVGKKRKKGGSCKVKKFKDQCENKAKKGSESGVPQGLFLAEGWRNELCRCDRCLKKYRDEQVEFLLDPEDTMKAYEEKGINKKVWESNYDQAMDALGQYDRGTQLDAIHHYNEMREELNEFLKEFAENGKVVTEEDIQEFFEGMRNKKKRRLE